MSAFLNFIEQPSKKKTRDFHVFSKTGPSDGHPLGIIYFRPQWRKYVFQGASDSLFDALCIRDIANFLDDISGEWRRSIQEKK